MTIFQFHSNFPTSARAFQLQFKLSNFTSVFPTSPQTFQLRLELSNFNLSNFILDFPISRSIQLTFPTTHIPLAHAEFGRNDLREYALHFILEDIYRKKLFNNFQDSLLILYNTEPKSFYSVRILSSRFQSNLVFAQSNIYLCIIYDSYIIPNLTVGKYR